MSKTLHSRRTVITGTLGTLGFASISSPLAAAALTPSATEGPFYPTPSMRRKDVDNDLVKLIGGVRQAGGEVIFLNGRVRDKTGKPLAGHRVEIWQCDTNGKYMHPGDRQNIPFDPAFQGFGHDITDADGAYVFRTIKPVAYPGRTPHIHVKVFDDTSEVLTTQFYLDGHPSNRRDGLFNRLSRSEARAVSMVFRKTGSGEVATVDITV